MSDLAETVARVIGDLKEADIARVLGIERKEVSRLRTKHLAPSHWYRESSGGRPARFGVVWLTAKGVKELYDALGVKPEQEPSPEKISAANAAEEVSVIRADYPNRRIIQVKTLEGKTKMMRVKDARMWVQGMKVMARPEGALDITLVPLRHPRFRGRF